MYVADSRSVTSGLPPGAAMGAGNLKSHGMNAASERDEIKRRIQTLSGRFVPGRRPVMWPICAMV